MSIQWAVKWTDAIEGDGYLGNLRTAILARDDAAVKHNLTEIRSITEAIAHEFGLDEKTLDRVGEPTEEDDEAAKPTEVVATPPDTDTTPALAPELGGGAPA